MLKNGQKSIYTLAWLYPDMIDKALLGAIERAIERNEPRELIKYSLVNSGYSAQDIDEAINLVMSRKQQSPSIVPGFAEKTHSIQSSPGQVQEPKQELMFSPKKSRFGTKDIVLMAVLSLTSLLFIIFYLYLRPVYSSCKTLNIAALKKEILGMAVNCNQVSIINLEVYIGFFTTLALLAIVIYLAIKKKRI